MRRGARNAIGTLGVVAIIGIIAGHFGGNTTTDTAGATAKPSPAFSNYAPPNNTEPPPMPGTDPVTKPDKVRILFRVTGDAPAGASITYGTDSDNRSPQGTGILGAVSVPFTASMKNNDNALYYFISAQLQGGGNITAKVIAKRTSYNSNGTPTITYNVLATAHASGGYNIALAES